MAKSSSKPKSKIKRSAKTRMTNRGSGAVAARGGVAAGKGGVAVAGSVKGDVVINNITKIYAAKDRQNAKLFLRQYFSWVVNDCAPLKLKAIDQSASRPGREPLGLANVYVDLYLELQIPQKMSLTKYLAAPVSHEMTEMPRERQELRRVSVLEAFTHHTQCVLLGKPGSGKSTFGAYLALSLAEAGLGNKEALKRLGKEWKGGVLLPIRVTLREFAALLPVPLPNGSAALLWQFILDDMKKHATLNDENLLKEIVTKRGALFVLDGLDETGDAARRACALECVADFIRAYSQCRFLITARPYAWAETEQRIADLPAVYTLDDFDAEQIRLFIAHWYDSLASLGWITPDESQNKKVELQGVVRRPDLYALAKNPLLLTLMATLHSNRTRLPDDRAELYNEVVELLLQRWNENIGADRSLINELGVPTLTMANIRGAVERLALHVHQANVGNEGTADISETELIEEFRDLLGGSRDKAERLVDYIEKRAGLLLGQGARNKIRLFTFPHRTFQEFLAGCALEADEHFEELVLEKAYSHPAHWREVLRFAARRARENRGTSAAHDLVHDQSLAEYRRAGMQPAEKDWLAAIVAGEMLLEIGAAAVRSREHYRVKSDHVVSWLVGLVENGALPVKERVRAGDVLGKLGDPRNFDEFRTVPAGKFWMGNANKDFPSALDETPEHEVHVGEFQIGKYPVTVGQWKKFVEATKYECHPASLHDDDNKPVSVVSWHDARAYCAWLTNELRRTNTISDDQEVRLPTESEWEKAARGTDKRIWTWGNDFDEETIKANINEVGIRRTCAVGIFPDGVSPYGCHDMIGNVWEWCQTKPKNYPYQADEREQVDASNDTRVVRGGSFGFNRGYARCAFRSYYRPYNRFGSFGFRVVVSPISRS